MKHALTNDGDYAQWIRELKQRVRSAQLKAAVRVNTTLLEFYWELGRDIVDKLERTHWGDGFLQHLSEDLSVEFPGLMGFSHRNIKYIRQWYLFYSKEFTIVQQAVAQLPLGGGASEIDQQLVAQLGNHDTTSEITAIGQQPVAQLFQIPWGHNILIVSKCQEVVEALFYVRKTIENNWSRAVLTHQIESGLHLREGRAITNFEATLPAPLSDLARETLKDPYTFDFLTLTERYDERELENALLDHLTRFLLELGTGFAFIGRQYRLTVAGDEFLIDLLFYHTRLHCHVVVELKPVKFIPEFAGKLSFYVAAVDKLLRGEGDNPTIGILICKSKNDTVVEYALRNTQQPIGVSEYELTRVLPDDLKPSLPSIEQIEAELDREREVE